MNQRAKHILTACFLALECILYYFILTAGGNLLIASSYISIVCCFLFALLLSGKSNPLMVAGLACTVGADFFLVVCSPRQQLWGMVFFLGAQILYAVKLHLSRKNRTILLIRLLLIVAIEIVAIIILKDKLDALAIVSVCYYANLFMNIIAAFTQWRRNKLLPIGLVAFILCDTVIGLQVAAGAYLPITEGSPLYEFLFMDFNLSWFFYLPSQVLIALSSLRKGEVR